MALTIAERSPDPGPQSPPPRISVIIPTCNRPDLLRRCLSAVTASIALAGLSDVEIVVSDDSSDDLTRQLVLETFPTVLWVRGPRRGPAANRNTAVAASSGEWLLFTDDDCIPSADWVRGFTEALELRPGYRAFEGRTVADRERRRLDEESPVNDTGGYLWSCNMAIRRDLFESLSGFCEDFPYAAMEDVDFRLRLIASGEAFHFAPAASVCHPYRRSKGLGFAVKTGKSYLHLTARHPELLGSAPWAACALDCARRARQLLRDAYGLRGRGLAHALAALAIRVYFEIVARTTRRPT